MYKRCNYGLLNYIMVILEQMWMLIYLENHWEIQGGLSK